MKEEKVWIGDHDHPEKKILGTLKVDKELGLICINPEIPQFPMILWDSRVVDKVAPYKRIIDHFITMLHDYFLADIQELTYEKMCKVSKEVYDVSNKIANIEKDERLRSRWLKVRDLLCLGLQTDDAYRLRFQLLTHLVNFNNLFLTEADVFWLLQKEKFDLREYLKSDILKLRKENAENEELAGKPFEKL